MQNVKEALEARAAKSRHSLAAARQSFGSSLGTAQRPTPPPQQDAGAAALNPRDQRYLEAMKRLLQPSPPTEGGSARKSKKASKKASKKSKKAKKRRDSRQSSDTAEEDGDRDRHKRTRGGDGLSRRKRS